MDFPEFDTVWRDLNKKYPALLRNSQENAIDYQEFLDLEELALSEGLLREEDLELYHERHSLSSSEKREISFVYDDALMSAEDAWKADPYVTEPMLKEYYEELYDDLITDLQRISGADIWRALKLPADADPTTLNPLGIYWAREHSGAGTYWDWKGSGTQEVIFHAEAPKLSGVDVEGTIEANLIPEFGADEKELRLKPGTKIFLLSIEFSDGKELPVKEWRTA